MSKKSSRRAFLSATVASFAWLITGDRASAATPAITAGTPCKAKGKERTVDGVTFVCRNTKGKLAWRLKPGEATVPVVATIKVVTVRVLESAELEVGKTKVVNAPDPNGGTTSVVLTRTSSGITALRINCTHAGFPVGLVGAVLECELHGSRFSPETGAVINGPATRALTRYEAAETNGGIYVTITSA